MTSPQSVRAPLRTLTFKQRIRAGVALRPGLVSDPASAVKTALWRIALVRMGCHQPTKDYVARRNAEGRTRAEIMRCFKRYIAREIFPHLLATTPPVRRPGSSG